MDKLMRDKVAIAVFALPALLVFTIFVFGVSFRTLIGSFYDWDGIVSGKFVGLQEYVRMFKDDVFYLSLKNGYISALVLLIFQAGLGLCFALILSNKKMRGKKLLRVAFFIPVVLSVTVGTQLWLSILKDEGLLNAFFHAIGLSYSQYWLGNGSTGIWVVSFINAWQYTGLYLSLFYAGIKSIPEHYFEAATIDGCNTFKTHFHITIPLLKEVMKVCVLLAMLGGLNQFAHNQIVTAGGPGNSTYSLTLLMYNKAFGNSDFGYGCAVAIIIIIQALLVVFIINKLFSKEKVVY
jgi:raffinose/stachyose/melibiose transport system permease protein